ncbi:hypothetical protein PC128_g23928 [Phytophthora cactorum]|nr:hypothetical protein PC128_g23928 [Phytophthora cactorum]
MFWTGSFVEVLCVSCLLAFGTNLLFSAERNSDKQRRSPTIDRISFRNTKPILKLIIRNLAATFLFLACHRSSIPSLLTHIQNTQNN